MYQKKRKDPSLNPTYNCKLIENAHVLTAILQPSSCSDKGCSIAVKTPAFFMSLQSYIGFKDALADMNTSQQRIIPCEYTVYCMDTINQIIWSIFRNTVERHLALSQSIHCNSKNTSLYKERATYCTCSTYMYMYKWQMDRVHIHAGAHVGAHGLLVHRSVQWQHLHKLILPLVI